LTGLGKRRAFDAALEECRDLMAAGHAPRIFILDLDNLKAVNDVSGHAAGDEAIRLMARAILERTRAVDQPFRIGGDEFAVIAIEGDGDAISKRLSEPAPFQPPTLWMRASVGWATCGIDALEPAEAVRLADRRMYEMKQARKAACE
ncbi:MAG: GGDEF domain-containing protein, partial [Dehalococcoidia bacterium]